MAVKTIKTRSQEAPEVSEGELTKSEAQNFVGPLIKYLGKTYFVESEIVWKMFKSMLDIAEGGGSNLGQINPHNFEYSALRKTLTMKSVGACTLPAYSLADADPTSEAAQVYALAMTLQFILTQEIPTPLEYAQIKRYEISDDAFELLQHTIAAKDWTTFAQLKASAWYRIAPRTRASNASKREDQRARDKLRQEYEAKSKLSVDFKP